MKNAAPGLVIGLIAAAFGGVEARGQGTAPEPAAIDRTVRAAVDSGFSGVVLVARGDSVIWRRAYPGRGPRLTTGSVFWIASMTKAFTAAAVLGLAERHRLSLHDSLGAFFPAAPRDKRGITVHQLLIHTAGLGGDYSGGGIARRDDAVRAILAPPLEHPPGEGYRYGDDDFELLAAIVEVVAGRPWEDVVRRDLLDRAGLRRTGFWCGRRRDGAQPVAGADGTRTRCGPSDRGSAADDWGHRGANGMSSTADDLLRWTRALMKPGVLGAQSRAALAAPQRFVRREGTADISIGYGCRVYGEGGRVTEVMRSGAGDDGHTGIVRVFPSGLIVIVLSNAGRRGDATWSSVVAERIAKRD